MNNQSLKFFLNKLEIDLPAWLVQAGILLQLKECVRLTKQCYKGTTSQNNSMISEQCSIVYRISR